MNKNTLIIIIAMFVTTAINIYYIEKHSVHPIYGNYKKVNSINKKCMPWDDCV